MGTRILNLQYPENSDIKYNIINFPDGEVQLDILDSLCNFKESVLVKTRITCANDWFILLQAQDILERNELDYSTIIFYLMSQRSDRLFSYTRPLSLKIVLSQLKNFSVFQAHNRTAICRLASQEVNPPYWPFEMNLYLKGINKEDTAVFFPDLHAYTEFRRYFYRFNHLYGEKKRDVGTGAITEYKICKPEKQPALPKVENILFFDDLCDGGGTFILALDRLKKLYPDTKFHLFVHHAVQGIGLQRVCSEFDTVTTTNSYAGWDNLNIPNLKVINIW